MKKPLASDCVVFMSRLKDTSSSIYRPVEFTRIIRVIRHELVGEGVLGGIYKKVIQLLAEKQNAVLQSASAPQAVPGGARK